jgi:hypothetical protein
MPKELTPGVEHNVSQLAKNEMAIAMNHHVVAKSIDQAIPDIDHMRHADTMQRMLDLAKTREGLAALQELGNSNKSE